MKCLNVLPQLFGSRVPQGNLNTSARSTAAAAAAAASCLQAGACAEKSTEMLCFTEKLHAPARTKVCALHVYSHTQCHLPTSLVTIKIKNPNHPTKHTSTFSTRLHRSQLKKKCFKEFWAS